MQRDILLQVARTCVANHAVTGFAFPCLEVNTADGEERGYVVLRRPGTPDIVLAPTKQVVGVEDPWLRTAEAPNYFGDACKVEVHVLPVLTTDVHSAPRDFRVRTPAPPPFS
jgi:CDP-diacylglycerol pyrophosphatase